MTRINLIDPKLLTDQHLFAECREINHIYSYVERNYSLAKFAKKKISATYTLNTGHVLFFVNKLAFIFKRHLALLAELSERGTHPNYEGLTPDAILALETRYNALPQELKNDYTYTTSEVNISLERIIQRINAKPSWYRFHGVPLTELDNNANIHFIRGFYGV